MPLSGYPRCDGRQLLTARPVHGVDGCCKPAHRPAGLLALHPLPGSFGVLWERGAAQPPPPVPLALPKPLSSKPLQALETSGQVLGLCPKAPPNCLRCPLLNSHFSSPSFSSPSSQGRGLPSGQSARPAADSLCLYLPQTLDGSSARPLAPPHWFQPLPRSGIPSSSAPGSWTTTAAPTAPRIGCFPLHPWDAQGKQGSRDGRDPVAGPCSGVRRHRFCRHRGYNAGIVPLARPHGSTRPGAVHRPWAFPELPGAGEEGQG